MMTIGLMEQTKNLQLFDVLDAEKMAQIEEFQKELYHTHFIEFREKKYQASCNVAKFLIREHNNGLII